jgi:hypothetical protein
MHPVQLGFKHDSLHVILPFQTGRGLYNNQSARQTQSLVQTNLGIIQQARIAQAGRRQYHQFAP